MLPYAWRELQSWLGTRTSGTGACRDQQAHLGCFVWGPYDCFSVSAFNGWPKSRTCLRRERFLRVTCLADF